MDPVVWILLVALVAGALAARFVIRRRQGTTSVDDVRRAHVGAEIAGHDIKTRQDSGTI